MTFLINLLLDLFKKKQPAAQPKPKVEKVEEKEYKPLPKNGSLRIERELLTLRRVNRAMFDMVYDLTEWIGKEFDKETILTMLYRTQEEQEQIYGKGYSKKSPHQFYHAVDIRSRIFSDEEIKRIEDYLNNKYNKTNYYKWTAKNHKVGNGAYHFHIQYVKK